MKFVKYFSIGSLLIGLTGFAFAEDGFERTKQFKENFRAEQARLWGPDSSEQGKQKVAQEKQEERQDRQEQADN
ncbi:hypothetical protein ACLIMJ_27245 [Pseudomonas veronii]|uniref:Secreted protein n=3 Tax=Pseudomonas TaxID=286 RepID=A0A1H1IWQ5_9PSED|nr:MULTISPECIES: hypothetical protein [Pseudomonas]AZP73490.1 hypothetical protein EJJ20_01170 [Pseudomonas poae]ETK21386.1 hypothetical protein H096_19970 [Pseudomonas sp. FH1]MBC8785440.1 hypothetical protein [Pseudomonas fluorescens]MCR4538462.1 hypothetical protein [Pseudomonas sp. 18.1.10]NMZ93977.1 hypothetical protein [Pseudomonas marginalis]